MISYTEAPTRAKEAARGARTDARRGENRCARGKDDTRARTLVRIASNIRDVGSRQRVQDSRDIKIAKPLWLCKNVKFGPSNVKFAKMHKSNAKLLESNF
jgi:hypothetical protein